MCVVYCSFTTLIVVLLKMLGIIQEGRLITRIPTAVNQRWLFLGTKRSYKTKGNQLAWLLNTNYSLMINKAALVIFPFFFFRTVMSSLIKIMANIKRTELAIAIDRELTALITINLRNMVHGLVFILLGGHLHFI